MELKYKEAEVLKEIKDLQEEIKELQFHQSYQSISTGPLIKGCDICTRSKSMTFVFGYWCNLDCPFCFVNSYKAGKPEEDEKYNRKVCLKDFYRKKDQIEGIGLTGGEPLLYLPQVKYYVDKIKEEKPDIYFWLYTNGAMANSKNLKTLWDLGIKEIRFNLAGTNYSNKVIEKVKVARKLFDYVAVEVPAYPKQKNDLLGCLEKLDSYGIDQLTLQELLINENNINNIEGEIYQSGMAFSRKYFLYGSRKLTYQIMRHCLKEGYSFTVNDCSARRFGKRKK